MCELCGVAVIGEGADRSRPGYEAVPEECRHCDQFLTEAPGRLSRSLDIRDLRNRVAIVLIGRKRTLEAFNFCLSSLDRASPACSSHPNYNPDIAFLDLTRYKKSDIDPNSAPPFDLQPHKHPELLYTLTLASFVLYGPDEFSLFCLRRAYHANPYIYQAFCTGVPNTPVPFHLNKLRNQLCFYFIYHRVLNVPGMKEWLVGNEEEVKRKACDAIGCRKVEETVGALKICSGCRVWWYCGTECQTRDWKDGGHRKVCKETQKAEMEEKSIGDMLLGAYKMPRQERASD